MKIRIIFILTFILTEFSFSNGRSLSFNEKELREAVSALKRTLERHHLRYDKEVKFHGTFQCASEDPEECDLSIDIANAADGGVLSGNDILNGIANGNGNDNGGNGNNSGNVVLQIFNIPIEDLKTTTETPSTTSPWYDSTWNNN